ncbi:inositol monophosphatase [bacterium]|nr:inositol monophosphatase [bacterium]
MQNRHGNRRTMNAVWLDSITREVETIALKAGQYLRDERTRIGEEEIDEKGQGDLVSRADMTSEQMLTEALHKLIPDSTILAEEEHASLDAGGKEWRWIVDPLDGTLNYLQGLPVYAVSIALEHRENSTGEWGELLAGVVYLPELQVLYSARRGAGAFRDGKPIRVREPKRLGRAVLATGFPFRNRERMEPFMALFSDVFLNVANVRRIGSAAADLCWVADGTFHGFWELGLSPWDIAAGVVLIEEAGGTITDFWGNPVLHTSYPLTATGEVYEFLAGTIRKHFPDPPERP